MVAAIVAVSFAFASPPSRAEVGGVSRADQAVASFVALFSRGPNSAEAKLAEFRRLFEVDKIDAWRFAEWGDSYAALYEATKDRSYFIALAKLSKLALEFRDDRQGRIDGLTGAARAAWGTHDRYFQKRAARIGVAALILAPIARLRRYAMEDPALAKTADIDPKQLGAEINAVMATFDELYEYRNRSSERAGRYLNPRATAEVRCDEIVDRVMPEWNKTSREMCARQRNLAGSPEAYNIQLRAALVLLLLGEPDSTERAREIAVDFFSGSDFAIGSEGAASFRYVEGGRPEDVSHFNLDAEFFLEASHASPIMQAAGRTMDRALLLALAKSITDKAAVRLDRDAIPSDVPSDQYVLTPYVDGRFVKRLDDQNVRAQVLGQRFSRIRRSCKQLSELVSVEPKIADVCGYDIKFERALTPSGLAHIAKGFREANRSSSP